MRREDRQEPKGWAGSGCDLSAEIAVWTQQDFRCSNTIRGVQVEGIVRLGYGTPRP